MTDDKSADSDDRKDGAPDPYERWMGGFLLGFAYLILASIFFMVGRDLFGSQGGSVLGKLADASYARGLITYLYAVGTIGVIILVVLAAILLRKMDDARITRAKDFVAILVGVFGTIVGYYFGAETSVDGGAEAVQVAQPFAPDTIVSGQPFPLRTVVWGGSPPYQYKVTKDSELLVSGNLVTSGWLNETLSISEQRDTSAVVEVIVVDRYGVGTVSSITLPVSSE